MGVRLKGHAQLACVEAFISYILKNIELAVRQYRMWKSYHFAVGFVGIKNTRAHTTYVFGEAHDQLFAY